MLLYFQDQIHLFLTGHANRIEDVRQIGFRLERHIHHAAEHLRNDAFNFLLYFCHHSVLPFPSEYSLMPRPG